LKKATQIPGIVIVQRTIIEAAPKLQFLEQPLLSIYRSSMSSKPQKFQSSLPPRRGFLNEEICEFF
jgi:hypothetical protein